MGDVCLLLLFAYFFLVGERGGRSKMAKTKVFFFPVAAFAVVFRA